MNKTEIQADIASTVGTILEEKLMNSGEPASHGNWYRALCRIEIGDIAQRQSVHYYVFEEGQGGEAAFYKDELPTKAIFYNDSTTAWSEVVQAEIATKESAGVIEKGTIKEINEEKELAVVEVYMMNATVLENRLYLAYKNPVTSGTDFKQIVQV